MKMYPRSEFPAEKFPAIVNAKGAISKIVIRRYFSALGCPNADVGIAAAVIKSGCDTGVALRIAMLAYYANNLAERCAERVTSSMLETLRRDHAEQFPHGKCAEDLAAQQENRPSRWGNPEFHAAARAASTY